uniref:Uncharacterized protein n=1 Tax=Anguilla anguilla TaxID=7936 RepID=A0A0E9QFR7_ANGAN
MVNVNLNTCMYKPARGIKDVNK